MAITLKVQKREAKTKPEAIRAKGFMPAIFYGKKEASTPISIAKPDFLKVWKQAGESAIVRLSGDGIEVESLIHDVTKHPVSGTPIHADFYVFEKGKKIKIKIPIHFVGTSVAVKDLGGTLVKVLYQIEIEALPKDLPHTIEVDIASLREFSSVIRAKDIILPPGAALIANPEEIVASVAEPRKIEEEAPATPVDLSTIEVAKKGKEAKEGETPEETAPEAPKKDLSAGKAGEKSTKK